MKKEKGFTLAEILITLAIIGVVAALTIASVVAKYQKQQYYTQFMKTYNTISNALTLVTLENGSYDTWGFIRENQEQNIEVFKRIIAPHLKISKMCNTKEDCNITSDTKYRSLYKDSEYKQYPLPDNYIGFLLQDGSAVAMYFANNFIWISFDTNGPQKGPNIVGRDIFTAFGYYPYNNQYRLLDRNMYIIMVNGYNITIRMLSREELEANIKECDPNLDEFGSVCSARLLLERKMSY